MKKLSVVIPTLQKNVKLLNNLVNTLDTDSTVSEIIQKQKVNIASLHCDRSSKGGVASMYIALDIPLGEDTVDKVKKIEDVFFVTNIRKLK